MVLTKGKKILSNIYLHFLLQKQVAIFLILLNVDDKYNSDDIHLSIQVLLSEYRDYLIFFEVLATIQKKSNVIFNSLFRVFFYTKAYHKALYFFKVQFQRI
ncbi:hypothetical protein ABPG72_014804 [Tetrahymena utriculariae]